MRKKPICPPQKKQGANGIFFLFRRLRTKKAVPEKGDAKNNLITICRGAWIPLLRIFRAKPRYAKQGKSAINISR